jgi:hypothetical protein
LLQDVLHHFANVLDRSLFETGQVVEEVVQSRLAKSFKLGIKALEHFLENSADKVLLNSLADLLIVLLGLRRVVLVCFLK